MNEYTTSWPYINYYTALLAYAQTHVSHSTLRLWHTLAFSARDSWSFVDVNSDWARAPYTKIGLVSEPSHTNMYVHTHKHTHTHTHTHTCSVAFLSFSALFLDSVSISSYSSWSMVSVCSALRLADCNEFFWVVSSLTRSWASALSLSEVFSCRWI